MILRIPGSYSNVMIDRATEEVVQVEAAAVGLAPQLYYFENTVFSVAAATAAATDPRWLQPGFKIEEKLNGTMLNAESSSSAEFEDSFQFHQHACMTTLKKFHAIQVEGLETEYNLFARIKLILETLLANGVEVLKYPATDEAPRSDGCFACTAECGITDLLQMVEEYEGLAHQSGSISGRKVVCHNDVTPYNFFTIQPIILCECWILNSRRKTIPYLILLTLLLKMNIYGMALRQILFVFSRIIMVMICLKRSN